MRLFNFEKQNRFFPQIIALWKWPNFRKSQNITHFVTILAPCPLPISWCKMFYSCFIVALDQGLSNPAWHIKKKVLQPWIIALSKWPIWENHPYFKQYFPTLAPRPPTHLWIQNVFICFILALDYRAIKFCLAYTEKSITTLNYCHFKMADLRKSPVF